MAIRKHPTKKEPNWWQIVISQGSHQNQKVYTVHCLRSEAEALEADMRGLEVKRTEQRVVDLFSRFIDWYTLDHAERTVAEVKRTFVILLRYFGHVHLSLLTRSEYERYQMERLAAGLSKRTINIELTYFRSFLSWADDNGFKISEKPRLFSKKSTTPPTPVILSPDEINRILDQLKQPARTIVQLMAWCGLRRNEALQLKRRNYDTETHLLIVTGKGNKTRIVPTSGTELQTALTAAAKDKALDDYLFINPKTETCYKDFKHPIATAAKKAGVAKHVYNHLMRHSFGTAAMAAGVNQRAIQGLLGHADIRTTELYTHLAAELLQNESLKIAGHMQRPSVISDSETTTTSENNK